MSKQSGWSIVCYAGELWVTLSDFTDSRDVQSYSDKSSVKSAVRTATLKHGVDKYIAFRGAAQLQNIVRENQDNPHFHPEAFQGTRTALISVDVLPQLEEQFPPEADKKAEYTKFKEALAEYVKELSSKPEKETNPHTETLRKLRQDLRKMDEELEIRARNREKLVQAIQSIESMEIYS